MNESRKIYQVKIAEDAADFIRQQSKKTQRQIIAKIRLIAENPQERGQPIRNSGDIFKVRAGRYRIAYKIQAKKLVVLVVRIGHRSD